MHRVELRRTAALVVLLLAGCGKIGAPAFASDSQMVGLNAALAAQAQSFYDALPAKTAPECGYAANEPGYAAMQQQATGHRQSKCTDW